MGRGWYAGLVLLAGASYGVVSPLIKIAYAHGISTGVVTASQYLYGMCLLWALWGAVRAWRRLRPGPAGSRLRAVAAPAVVAPAARGGHADRPRIAGRDVLGLLVLGALGAGTSILYYQALRQLPAWLGIVLLSQFSWMTFAIDFAWTRRRPRGGQWTGIVAIVAGTLLAAGIGAGGGHLTIAGVGFGLAAGMSYAGMLYVSGLAALRVPPVSRAAFNTTFAVIWIFVMYPPTVRLFSGVFHAWLYGGLTAVFSQVAPALLFAVAVPRVGGTAAAVLGSIELPVAVVLAALWLGERVTISGVAGIALICGGIVWAEWSAARARGLAPE